WSGLPAPGSAGRCPFALPLRSRRVPLRLVALAPFRLRAPVLRGGLFLQFDRHTIVLERDPLALLRLRLLRLPLQVLLLSLGAGRGRVADHDELLPQGPQVRGGP